MEFTIANVSLDFSNQPHRKNRQVSNERRGKLQRLPAEYKELYNNLPTSVNAECDKREYANCQLCFSNTNNQSIENNSTKDSAYGKEIIDTDYINVGMDTKTVDDCLKDKQTSIKTSQDSQATGSTVANKCIWNKEEKHTGTLVDTVINHIYENERNQDSVYENDTNGIMPKSSVKMISDETETKIDTPVYYNTPDNYDYDTPVNYDYDYVDTCKKTNINTEKAKCDGNRKVQKAKLMATDEDGYLIPTKKTAAICLKKRLVSTSSGEYENTKQDIKYLEDTHKKIKTYNCSQCSKIGKLARSVKYCTECCSHLCKSCTQDHKKSDETLNHFPIKVELFALTQKTNTLPNLRKKKIQMRQMSKDDSDIKDPEKHLPDLEHFSGYIDFDKYGKATFQPKLKTEEFQTDNYEEIVEKPATSDEIESKFRITILPSTFATKCGITRDSTLTLNNLGLHFISPSARLTTVTVIPHSLVTSFKQPDKDTLEIHVSKMFLHGEGSILLSSNGAERIRKQMENILVHMAVPGNKLHF
ncbi:hypothetical protein MAR_025816 [Mya arenaria]|uniref:B box-type domain-containing protein n=1 Tax=Mya arenaria TaxID=6604 RepID=A0ABY7EWT2_MYAAR|nr:uncharacterized protein LOC128242928 [Mya arenaria]WAR11636.1 hypothetical protein MAR_025816 [Mya arenaria]